MENLFENQSKKITVIHELDARVKIISAILFILISSSLQSYMGLVVGASLLLVILKGVGASFSMAARRLTWVFLFGGSLVILFPFITPGNEMISFQIGSVRMAASGEGLDKAIHLFLRLLSAVLAVGILNATTGFREIITGLRKLGVPGLLTSILEFTVRYLFVLGDELKRMKLARKARAYNMNKSILHREARKTIVQLLAVMFLRSIGRAERVYCAMLARGYNGEPSEAKAEHIHQTDLIWGTGFIFLTLCIKLLEVGGLIG